MTIALWLAILIAAVSVAGGILKTLWDGLVGFVRWLQRIAA